MKTIYKYIILILGLILLIIGGVSLYITNHSAEELEKLDINSALVQKLYKYVDHKDDNSGLSVYLITTDSVEKGNIDDAFKFMVALRNIEPSTMKIDESKCQISISKSIIDESMKKVFNNADYEKTKEYSSYLNVTSSCGSIATFKYDSLTNNYIGNIYALGGLDNFQSPFQTKLYEAYRDNKNGYIYIKEKLLYLKEDCNEDACNYVVYKDFNYKEEVGKENGLKAKEKYDFFDKYFNQASTVTYTFKLKNNQYYFYSSKVDK